MMSMSTIAGIDEEISVAMQRMSRASEAYEKKFGVGTLDRVIVHDPTWLDADNFNDGAEKLEQAIKKNKPIEQIPEEMWKTIVF